MTDKPALSPKARESLMLAMATRGPNKGLLRAKAPPSQTLAYAAWQGAQMACNPFKVSIFGTMFMTDEQKAIRDEVTAYLDARPALARVLDRDRSALEQLGAW
jgi:hypothetical protein